MTVKEQMIDMCERKLDYYDIVDERSETVDYGKIIDFLVENYPVSMVLESEVSK